MKDKSNNENLGIIHIIFKGEIVCLLLLNKFIINLYKEIVCNLNIINQAIQ